LLSTEYCSVLYVTTQYVDPDMGSCNYRVVWLVGMVGSGSGVALQANQTAAGSYYCNFIIRWAEKFLKHAEVNSGPRD
jgi:hypothetical protein